MRGIIYPPWRGDAEFAFAAGNGARRPIAAIRTSARDKVEAVRGLIRWPRHPSDDWVKGFLGIFDAEGSFGGVVRIANTDQEIIDWTRYGLRRLGFGTSSSARDCPTGCRTFVSPAA